MNKSIFKNAMERHKRLDSWIVTIIVTSLFFYFLWLNYLILSVISFILIFILPFLFPKPKKKIKFIDAVIEWEIAWCEIPPYSKLIDWVIEAIGFILAVYGTWQHNYLIILLGVAIIIIGPIDFLVRFGYKRVVEKDID